MRFFGVSLPPDAAAERVREAVERSGYTARRVGAFRDDAPGGERVEVMVFEKFYLRTSGRTGLTVAVSDLSGETAVWAVGSGGADGGLLRPDFGAQEAMEWLVYEALEDVVLWDRS